MATLEELMNERVFYYFSEICSIPHGSGHIEAISDYLCSFASKRELEYVQDELGNVVIYKPATAGYEDIPGVILQGHMDMVLAVEKEYENSIDMLCEPLRLFVEGDYLGARHTTLGGDDGIALAMMLALLDSEDIPHPALEAIVTVDEEVGMEGAAGLDSSLIKYDRLINIDNEVEGQIITGCAGGGRVEISLPLDEENISGALDSRYIYKLAIEGCKGGHSGVEIHHGRANANMIIGRLLYRLAHEFDGRVSLTDICGGNADNAIPSSAYACIAIDNSGDRINDIEALVSEEAEKIKIEYSSVDPDMIISLTKTPQPELVTVYSSKATRRVANLIYGMPGGVMTMSADVAGLVETSLNLGILKIEAGEVQLHFSVRSSVASAKQAIIDKLSAIAELAGANVSISGVYPGWKYQVESPLRERCISVYKKLFDREPIVEAIHAGLECGFFMDKKEGIDCISIGPDILDIHTPRERLSISSTRRTWSWLCELLKDPS